MPTLSIAAHPITRFAIIPNLDGQQRLICRQGGHQTCTAHISA